MKIKAKNLLAAAAIGGLLTGNALYAAHPGQAVDGSSVSMEEKKDSCSGKDGCKAKDSCKGKDKKDDKKAGDKNSCSGKDGCGGKDKKP